MAIYSIKNLHGHDGAFLIKRGRLVIHAQVKSNSFIVIKEVESRVIGPEELDLFVEPGRQKEPKPRKILKPGIFLSALGTVLVGICALFYKGFSGPDSFSKNANQTIGNIGAALGIKEKTASHPEAIKDLILSLKEGDIVTVTRAKNYYSSVWSYRTVLTGIAKPVPEDVPLLGLKGFRDFIVSSNITKIIVHKSRDQVKLSLTDEEIEENVIRELSSIKLGSKIKATDKIGNIRVGILEKYPFGPDEYKCISIEYDKSLDTYGLGYNSGVWPVHLPVHLIEKIGLLNPPSDDSKITSPAENPQEKNPISPIDRARKIIEEKRNFEKDTHDLAKRA